MKSASYLIWGFAALMGMSALSAQAHMRGEGREAMKAQIDSNKDGQVSRDEMQTFLRDHAQKIDANKDGKLSPEEFKTYREARRTEMRTQRMDANKDGAVSVDEFVNGAMQRYDRRHGGSN